MPLTRLRDDYLEQDGVRFLMVDEGGSTVACRVSHEALRDHANRVQLSGTDGAVFEAYRELIEELASAAYDAETHSTIMAEFSSPPKRSRGSRAAPKVPASAGTAVTSTTATLSGGRCTFLSSCQCCRSRSWPRWPLHGNNALVAQTRTTSSTAPTPRLHPMSFFSTGSRGSAGIWRSSLPIFDSSPAMAFLAGSRYPLAIGGCTPWKKIQEMIRPTHKTKPKRQTT